MEADQRNRPATIRVASSIGEIGREAWDAVANPGWPSDRPLASGCGSGVPYNPFIAFDFLDCLEQSGCATRRNGWTPRHLVLEEQPGAIAAAMPLYLKSHSMGEYVFDHGWADAHQRAGGRYYPKLQSSVPFTPVTGRRLLTPPGAEAADRRRALAEAAIGLVGREQASSVHITFMPEDEWDAAVSCGYLKRVDRQFHFVNDGYRDFADFLASLASRKRKALKRERREALSGLTVDLLTGSDLTEAAWDSFFAFYMDTGGRKWGRPYLNRRFFSMIGERMPDRILLVMAHNGRRYMAGALNLIGSEALYGRYWGTTEHRPFLHFELCYYQAVDWALARGLRRVEAGAQGEHKLARGYLPTPTYSAHWIADLGFRRAVSDYLAQERRQAALEAKMAAEHSAFRRAGG